MGVQSVVKTRPVLVHTHHLLHIFKTGVGGHHVEKRRAILLFDSYATKVFIFTVTYRVFFLTKRSDIC